MNAPVRSPSLALRQSEGLLGLNSLLWAGLALAWIAASWKRPGEASPGEIATGTFMLGNAAILAGAALKLRSGGPTVLHVAMFWVGVNLVLSFTDQVGLIDWPAGSLNALTLLTLTALWRRRRRVA